MRRPARTLTRRASLLATVALASLVALAAGASPAAATDPPIAIAANGVDFGPSYPGQLFGGVVLIPGATATKSFWVKNTGSSDANLAMTVIDVDSVDPDLLAALTVTIDAGTHFGSVSLDQVGECASLVRGVALSRGRDVRVDVTFSMANVDGTTAQGAAASFNLGVNLTSTDVAAPDGCTPAVAPPPSPTPKPTPNPPSTTAPGGPAAGGGSSVVIPGVTGGISQPGTSVGGGTAQTPSPQPTVAPSLEPVPTPSPQPVDTAPAELVANTDRFYQEYFVAGWVAGFVLGGVLAWRTMRRREVEGGRP